MSIYCSQSQRSLILSGPIMRHESIIVLCPPHATTACGGPRGVLGDRIHQLAVLTALAGSGKALCLWPRDGLTESLFGALKPQWIDLFETDGVPPDAKVIGLFGMPENAQPESSNEALLDLDRLARQRWGDAYQRPDWIDPRSARPVWEQLTQWLETLLGERLPGIQLPLLPAVAWHQMVCAAGQKVVIVSPLAGAVKGAFADGWWRDFAQSCEPHRLVVPIMPEEEAEARQHFVGASNVSYVSGSIEMTAAMAMRADAAIGVDGGRLNLIAASRAGKVLGFYAAWPASAWALPNVQACDFSMRPEEAARALGLCG